MNLKSFIGVILYFAMNMLLIWFFISPGGYTAVYELAIIYLLIISISLSPIGEWMLCLLANAKPIPRKDMNVKIIPLLELVLARAKQEMPPMVSTIRLRFIDDPAPMAYALGRKTICVTEGLLRMPDELIIGALSHEVAHLALKHMTTQLLFGGGNIFITGFVFLIKLSLKILTLFSGISIFTSQSKIVSVLMTVLSAVTHLIISAWTKLSMLFLCWSKREDEYQADKFAFDIGFGNELATVLDKLQPPQKSSFIQVLLSSHPTAHERIGRLQQYGSSYSSY